MRIEEAVEYMSKIFLHRILDSYIKDTIKPDEETSRKRITADKDLLANPDNIHQRLHLAGISFNSKVLSNFLLEVLLDSENSCLDERTIINLVTDFEQRVVEEASTADVLKFKDQGACQTYKTVPGAREGSKSLCWHRIRKGRSWWRPSYIARSDARISSRVPPTCTVEASRQRASDHGIGPSRAQSSLKTPGP